MKITILSIIEFLLLAFFIFLAVIYTDEPLQAIGIAGFYILGRCFIQFILQAKEKVVIHSYNCFFILYAYYMLLTHYVCITDPFSTYFLHNDASDAFYFWTIWFSKYPWHELPERVLTSYFFSTYPGAGTWFVSLAKTAQALGIENLRFFLRLQSVMAGACIMGIMAKCLVERNCCNSYSIRQLYWCGLFSYLLMCSVIFSRDILVAFCYTYLGYLFLKPESKHRILKMLLVSLVAGLMRPMNGMFALLFVFAFLFWKYRQRRRAIIIISIGSFIILGGTVLVNVLSDMAESIVFYQGRNMQISEGLFMKLYSLPFPFNLIFIVTYSMLLPLPLNHFITMGLEEGGGWVALPTITEPFYWTYILICVSIIFVHIWKNEDKTTWLLFVGFIYIITTEFMESNIRRTFAIYPTFTMIYIVYRSKLSDKTIASIKRLWWPTLLMMNFLAILYLMK